MPLEYHCEYCNLYRTFQNSQEKFYFIKKHRQSKAHQRNEALHILLIKSASLSITELQEEIARLEPKKDMLSKTMINSLKDMFNVAQKKEGLSQ